jgi:hypothetical protein
LHFTEGIRATVIQGDYITQNFCHYSQRCISSTFLAINEADLYAVEIDLRSAIHPYGTQPSQVEIHWNDLIVDESAQEMEP